MSNELDVDPALVAELEAKDARAIASTLHRTVQRLDSTVCEQMTEIARLRDALKIVDKWIRDTDIDALPPGWGWIADIAKAVLSGEDAPEFQAARAALRKKEGE